MTMRNFLMGSLLVAATLWQAPAFAGGFGLYINVAPPAPRYEVVPRARPGYFWAPGYWEWDGRRHIWIGGHWVVERPGYGWVEPRWEHNGSRWYYTAGYWNRRGDYNHRGDDHYRDDSYRRSRYDNDRYDDRRHHDRDRDRDRDGDHDRDDHRH